MMNKTIVIFFCFTGLLLTLQTLAQEPQIIRQLNFNGIDNIYTGPEGKYFLVQQGGGDEDDFFLYDQFSKVMIGKITLGTSLSSGSGKVVMLPDGKFLFSQDQKILKCDPLKQDTSTFFDQIKYPELLLDFKYISNNRLVISTKIYPQKNG